MDTILLVAVNSKFIHSNPAIYSIKSFAEKCGREFNVPLPRISLCEFSVNDTEERILFEICDKRPDVIGFSVYIWNCNTVWRLCRKLRRVLPDTKIILGGPQVSFSAESLPFTDDDYDYIIQGEGEKPFFSLAGKIFANGFVPPREWNFFLTGKICKCDDTVELDEFPFIYTDENIKSFENRIVYYESSRGCPFRCAYCLSSLCGNVRSLSLERVKRDLKFFIDKKIPHIKFVDRTFNYDKKRAKEIWKFLIEKHNENFTDFHFEISADILDEESIEILNSAPVGLFKIEAGIQSYNEDTLREIGRISRLEILTENLKRIAEKNNITLHSDLIFGLPLENTDSFILSFNEAYKIRSHQLQLGFLKLLPGAPLNGMIEKHGFVFSEEPPYEIISNNYISFSDVIFMKKIEDVFEKYYNSGRFSFSLDYLEKFFETPFEMYKKIAEKSEEKNLIFQSVSTKILYCFLHDFFEDFSRENLPEFDRILLLDFYSSDRSNQLPSSLRYLSPENRKRKNELSEQGFRESLKSTLRFIGNEIYIFDYESKNPVTQKYDYKKADD